MRHIPEPDRVIRSMADLVRLPLDITDQILFGLPLEEIRALGRAHLQCASRQHLKLLLPPLFREADGRPETKPKVWTAFSKSRPILCLIPVLGSLGWPARPLSNRPLSSTRPVLRLGKGFRITCTKPISTPRKKLATTTLPGHVFTPRLLSSKRFTRLVVPVGDLCG